MTTHPTDSTSPTYASAADVATYGAYRIAEVPGDTRPRYRFGGRITADGSSGYAAEAGRYHVYAGWFCPWAQRVVIAIELNGLTDVVGVSYVHGERDARGWGFREPTGADPVNGFALLRDAYDRTEPAFDGHVSVPTLWDRATGRVVSNRWDDIGIDLATQFGALATPIVPTYPAALAGEIEALDAWIGPAVNVGVNAAAAGDADARVALLDAFARLDALLAERPFLVGHVVTEADIRLYVTLIRYDVRSNADRSINAGLGDYPNLDRYLRDLYDIPAFRDSTRFESFAAGGAALPDWANIERAA